MSSRSSLLEPLSLMQIALGLFFGLAGLFYLTNTGGLGGGEVMSGMKQLLGNETLRVIVALIMLAAGAVLIVGLFGLIPGNILHYACLAILILWIIKIIMSLFFNNFLKPDFLAWLALLSSDLIVLAGAWGVSTTSS